MISNLMSSLNSNIVSFLDDLVFINSDITNDLVRIIGTTSFTGIQLVCNSLIYGFLLYYGIRYLLSHLTFSQVERPSQFIFKLVLCALALNASEMLCSLLINLCSQLTGAINSLGEYILGTKISFETLINNILPQEYFSSNSFSLFSFDGILKTSISFGFLNLTVAYTIRYILIKVFVVLAPFAILTLSTSKTSSFFKSWFKCFLSLLLLQIFISVILLVCFVIANNQAIIPKQILYLGIVYTLFKANSFLREFIGGLSTDVTVNLSNFTSMFKGG